MAQGSRLLVQTGKNLSDAQNMPAGLGEAFAEGFNLIENQRVKNAENDMQYQKDMLSMKRQQLSIEAAEDAARERKDVSDLNKRAYFDNLDDAYNKGILSKEVYQTSLQDREKWWKEKGTAIKGAGIKEVEKAIADVTAAEANWGNAIRFAKDAQISDNSPEAQRIDRAIEEYARQNGSTPPAPSRDENGNLVYKIPVPGGEDVVIPVDKIKNLGDSDESLFGIYDKPFTPTGIFDDFGKGNPGVLDRFGQGQGTREDVAAIEKYYDDMMDNPTKLKELGMSLLQQTGFDYAKYGIGDTDGDGEIGYNDLDTNLDGEVSPEEAAVLRQVYLDTVTARFPGEQAYQRDEGELSSDQAYQADTLQKFLPHKDKNGKVVKPSEYTVDDLGKIAPGVIGHTERTGDGKAKVFFTGKNGRKDFMEIEINEDGTLTEGAVKQLMTKLGIADAQQLGVHQQVNAARLEREAGQEKANRGKASQDELRRFADAPEAQTGQPFPEGGEKGLQQVWAENNPDDPQAKKILGTDKADDTESTSSETATDDGATDGTESTPATEDYAEGNESVVTLSYGGQRINPSAPLTEDGLEKTSQYVRIEERLIAADQRLSEWAQKEEQDCKLNGAGSSQCKAAKSKYKAQAKQHKHWVEKLAEVKKGLKKPVSEEESQVNDLLG